MRGLKIIVTVLALGVLGIAVGSGSAQASAGEPDFQIAVSETETCATDALGMLHCWGPNFDACGDFQDTTGWCARWTSPPLRNIVQMRTNPSNQFCALSGDGQIRCWGSFDN